MKLTEMKREKWKKLTMCTSLASELFQLNQHKNKLLQLRSRVQFGVPLWYLWVPAEYSY